MNKSIYQIITVTLVAMLFAACGQYSKLLKSDDADLKYRMGLQYFEEGKYQRTLALLHDVEHIYNSTDRSDSLMYYIGTSYYKQGQFEASGYAFDHFRQSYTNSPFLEDAEYMYAMGFYYSSPGPERDQSNTIQALGALGEYIQRYPNSVKKEEVEEHMQELTQKLHDKAYLQAKTYYTIRAYKASAISLKNALNKYPNSSHREEIMYLIVKSNYLYARNSIEHLQRDRYMRMLDSYYSFVADYPESSYLKELQKMDEEAKEHIAKYQDGEESLTGEGEGLY